MNNKFRQTYITIIFYLGLIIFICWVTTYPEFSFKGIMKMISKFSDWIRGSFFLDLAFTFLRVLAGFSIAVILGILAGILTGKYSYEYKGVIDGFNYLRAITPVALAPFFLIIFGISESSKILLIAWGAFFPIWISTYIGIKILPSNLVHSSRLLGLNGWKAFKEFYLPAAISGGYSGMRVGIGISYILVFISESLGANYGIGYRLGDYYDTIQIPQMMNALLVLGFLGLYSDKMFVLIFNYIFPWKKYDQVDENQV